MAQTETGAADRESVHARVLNASREHVVHAFRAPEHFAQWWGSKDFRNTIHSFEFRPGGRLELTFTDRTALITKTNMWSRRSRSGGGL